MFRQASTKLLVLGLLFTTLNAQVVTQKYAQGKLFMKNGMTIEGKDMQMTMENVTIVVMDIPQVFPLSDVSQVMAKQGKAKKYGRNCAGVCVGLNLFSLLMTSGVTMEDEYGNEVEVKQLLFCKFLIQGSHFLQVC